MKKPKPIILENSLADDQKIILSFIDGEAPYIYSETGDKRYYGFIKDRDIKRLKKWCEDCLKGKHEK